MAGSHATGSREPDMTGKSDVTIIGAGIVGVCAGLFLQRDGLTVTIVDRVEPGMSCSFGNAGMICTTDSAIPLPSFGVLRDLPHMLFDSSSPLNIRWRYLPRLAPWLFHFMRAAPHDRRMAGARALYDLLEGTTAAYDELAANSAVTSLIRRNGMLLVYETDEGFAGDAKERGILTSMGATIEELGADELRQMEPVLTPKLKHATYLPQSYSTVNPYKLTRGLADDFIANGGTIVQAEVTGLQHGNGQVTTLETDQGDIAVSRLVVAAGAWSARVAKMMGLKVLLDTERGYHTVFHGIDTGLTRPVLHGERHCGINQMDDGIRFAGTVELASVDAPENLARADNVYQLGRAVFRDLDPSAASETTRWMGCRPTMPDYLPALGAASGFNNVWFDFGHQHLGLTMAARSGQIVADLIAGRDPGLDLTPFRADRF